MYLRTGMELDLTTNRNVGLVEARFLTVAFLPVRSPRFFALIDRVRTIYL